MMANKRIQLSISSVPLSILSVVLILTFGILFTRCKGKTGLDTRDVPVETARQAGNAAETGTAPEEGATDQTGTVPGTDPGSDPASYESMMALQEAALMGTIEDVVQLVQKGVNVNAVDSAGRTPMMFAAFNGHTEIVRLLLDSGAETEPLDSTGRTALIYGSTGPFPETAELPRRTPTRS